MTHIEYPGDEDSPDAGIRVSRRIADELRRTRVAHGLSIEDVAAVLRIRAGFIEAMEEDRFDDLPGPAYISGFLRTYASHLGLDGDQLVAWFKDDSHSTFAPREMELLVPISEIRRPTFPIITVSLVIAIVIAVAWYVFQERRSIDIDLIPEVPGPVAEGTSTDLPDDEGSVDLNGGNVFDTVGDVATDAAPATVEPDDETADVAGTDVLPDDTGMTADDSAADVAPDVSGMAVDDSPDDAAPDAGADSLLVTAGVISDDDAAGLASDVAGATVDGGPDDAAVDADVDDDSMTDVVLDTEAATLDDGPDDAAVGDDSVADVALDAEAVTVDAGPDDAAADVEAVIPQDTVDDGAADAVPDSVDDSVTGVETDTQQGEVGTGTDVVLPDVADATGAESGGEETWDEPVFASEDTFEESAAVDEGEEDSQHTVYGTPGAGSRIELRAIDETWVQVTAPDGVAVLTHILLPGDVYHVPDRDDLMLDTGNAGGLEIRVDGELMPPLGGAGAVVRDVLLSVESLTRR